MITDRLIALGASLSNRPTSCLYVGINDSNQVVYTNAVEGLSVEVDVVDLMTAPSLEALSEFAC
ncbi:MAG: hypothetical protein RR280_08595 [Bacteroidaceae bacterium]